MQATLSLESKPRIFELRKPDVQTMVVQKHPVPCDVVQGRPPVAEKLMYINTDSLGFCFIRYRDS